MIYIEKDYYGCSLFVVEEVGGKYFGWSEENTDGWEGNDYTLYPNEEGYSQTFLAPSILGRW